MSIEYMSREFVVCDAIIALEEDRLSEIHSHNFSCAHAQVHLM